MKFLVFLFLFSSLIGVAQADRVTSCLCNVKERTFFTTGQKMANFGIVYGAQWGVYLLEQQAAIKNHGSLRNWYTNPLKPHFDKDSFDYNVFWHSVSGASYFLWYRSRGYDVHNAFVWSFLSSLAFEFTIETVTERPSYQDIYQTPVFGSILGVGVESLSNYLHSLNTWYGSALGYILNPFTLIPQQEEASVNGGVILNEEMRGYYISYRF